MKKENSLNNGVSYLDGEKFIQGCVVGSFNAIITTPFAGLANHVNNRKSTIMDEKLKLAPSPTHSSLSVSRMFDGALCYNMAFIMRAGVSIALNSALIHLLEYEYQIQLNEKDRLGISVIAGGLAGAPANIPEAAAQIKQLHNEPGTKPPSAPQIIKRVYQSNGLFGLGRGTVATMARSAGLASGYLQVMPMVSDEMRQRISDPLIADFIAAIISGIWVGVITTPLNRLRFLMHKEYTSEQSASKYRDLICKEVKSKQIFTGFIPRTAYGMATMFIIHKGNQAYKLYSEQGYPDLPWFQPK